MGNFQRIRTIPQAGEKVVALATRHHSVAAWRVDHFFILQRVGPLHVSFYVNGISYLPALTALNTSLDYPHFITILRPYY